MCSSQALSSAPTHHGNCAFLSNVALRMHDQHGFEKRLNSRVLTLCLLPIGLIAKVCLNLTIRSANGTLR
jgi:hypothetical protein